jgi:endoglucanase
MTEEMRTQFTSKGEELPQQALTNSSLIQQYQGSDPIQIRKVNNNKPLFEASTLTDSYSYYKSTFVSSDGKVVAGDGRASADLQSQALYMALFNDDPRTFDAIWVWTAYNLQMSDNLMKVDSNLLNVRNDTDDDNYTNTRVDTDIALALVLASQKWHDDSYTKEALYIVKAIWDNEVIEINKKPYLKATALKSGQLEDQVLLNLGAFSPQAYRLFAEIDPKHDWMSLYNSGYDLLKKSAWYGRGDYQGVGLNPGLVVMNTESEDLRSTVGNFGQRLGDFDEEAQQALWRVVLDYRWYNSDQARDFIQGSSWFLVKYWQKWQVLPGQFTNNGLPIMDKDSSSMYAVTSAESSVLDELDIAAKKAKGLPAELGGSSAATEILARAFMGSFYHKDNVGYWQQKDNAATQYWSWMATAMNMNRLNLTGPAAGNNAGSSN